MYRYIYIAIYIWLYILNVNTSRVAAKMLKSVCSMRVSPRVRSSFVSCASCFRRVHGGGGRVMGFPSRASIRLSLSILDN